MQLLAYAFVDDTPEITWTTNPSPGWFYNLKLYDAGRRLCTSLSAQSTDGDHLAADRKLWQTISELLVQKWTLDDALYELTASAMMSRVFSS